MLAYEAKYPGIAVRVERALMRLDCSWAIRWKIRSAPEPPLAKLKLLKADPAQVLAQSEEIKARYTKLFKV